MLEELTAINIGSNPGLARILRMHYEKTGQDVDEALKYTAFNVDINIFDRIAKVYSAISCMAYHIHSLTLVTALPSRGGG